MSPDPSDIDARLSREPILDKFEVAWNRGELPQLEAFLPLEPEGKARESLFRDLLAVELAFLADPARAEVRDRWRERLASNSRLGSVRAAGGVIERPDFTPHLKTIRVHTLIITGEQDRAVPPAESVRMHERIAGSRLVTVPDAGHAVPIENPVAVATAVDSFLRFLAEHQPTLS